MEELQSTEALDREILEDARKKAAKILKNADDSAAASKADWQRKLEQTLSRLRESYAQKKDKSRLEIMARLPMDKRRVRSEKIEGLLSGAMTEFLASLSREQLLRILERELAERVSGIFPADGEPGSPAGGVPVSTGAPVSGAPASGVLRYRGLSAEEVSALSGILLPRGNPGLSLHSREEPIPAPGKFPAVVIDFPRLRITSSVDRTAENLLLDKRAELAEALLGEQGAEA